MWLVDMARGQSREHHGLDLWVCPSHATLARLLGTSERTVRRHIARLVREGWLRRVGRCAPGRAQTYELCVPSWITQEEIDAAQSASAWINRILGVGGGGLMTIGQMSEIGVLALIPLIGTRPANTAPSYRGRTCWAGVEYFTVDKNGDAWSCRTAKRFDEGALGNIFDGTLALAAAPSPCTYDICPCSATQSGHCRSVNAVFGQSGSSRL